MTIVEPNAHWVLPIVAFVVATTVTAALRGERDELRPAHATPDVAGVIAAPRLSDVPHLPTPLATPRARARPARVATPAPTVTVAPPAATPTPPTAAVAPAAPAPPTPGSEVPAPQPTPAPTFDDSGSGPVFDDSGPDP
jgi:hypothetical protein